MVIDEWNRQSNQLKNANTIEILHIFMNEDKPCVSLETFWRLVMFFIFLCECVANLKDYTIQG